MTYYKIEKDNFVSSRPWKLLISMDGKKFRPYDLYSSKKVIMQMMKTMEESGLEIELVN